MKNTFLLSILSLNFYSSATTEQHPLIFQISPARCGSTALLQSFSQNKEFMILNEPMLKPFVLSLHTDGNRPQFKDLEAPETFKDFEEYVLLLQKKSPVYVKDMIFFSNDWLKNNQNLLENENIKFILLLRHPYDSMMSFYKKVGTKYMAFQSHAYQQMWELYNVFKSALSPDRYIVLEAEELFSQPQNILENSYKHLGLSFSPEVLSWEPKEDGFDGSLWLDSKTAEEFHFWHEDAIKSTGFNPLKTVTSDYTFKEIKKEDKELMQKLYEEALMYYNKLKDAMS